MLKKCRNKVQLLKLSLRQNPGVEAYPLPKVNAAQGVDPNRCPHKASLLDLMFCPQLFILTSTSSTLQITRSAERQPAPRQRNDTAVQSR